MGRYGCDTGIIRHKHSLYLTVHLLRDVLLVVVAAHGAVAVSLSLGLSLCSMLGFSIRLRLRLWGAVDKEERLLLSISRRLSEPKISHV